MTTHYLDIRYSHDGGRNWSNWRTVDLGTVGSYGRRCRIRRLGSGFQPIFQFRDTSPFKADLLAVSIQASTA